MSDNPPPYPGATPTLCIPARRAALALLSNRDVRRFKQTLPSSDDVIRRKLARLTAVLDLERCVVDFEVAVETLTGGCNEPIV